VTIFETNGNSLPKFHDISLIIFFTEILKPNEGGDVCDTSNTEVLKFVKCLTELENLVSV